MTHARTAPHRRHIQRGQATIEWVVLALALVPLFLLVPLVGKFIDLAQTTEAASRYVAFEGMARHSGSGWKDDAMLAAEVRRRFFGNSDAPVKTNDVAGNFAAHRNPLWSDPAGHPLIERFADNVAVRTEIGSVDAIATAAFASAFALPHDNLLTGSVTVRAANVRGLAPFDTLGWATTRRTALLADAWTATDSAGIRRRIEAAATVFPIAAVRELVDTAGQLPTLVFDPALRVGDFDWDVVPCDRLVGGC
jgi:hypothetical protein